MTPDRNIYYWENRRPAGITENNDLPEWVPGSPSTPAQSMYAFDQLPALLRGFLNYCTIDWHVPSVLSHWKGSYSQKQLIDHMRETERKATGHVARPPGRVRRPRRV